jgi:hypothetical protein
MIRLPTYLATRYVQPLREGGSLPAIVETEEGGLYVVKFRGAGQGPRALIAELVVGMLATAAGLPVPELAAIELPDAFGLTEPDPEIRDLLRASTGTNVGLRYLDGAFNYDARAAGELLDPEFSARTVWLDAWLTNPDRTARNPNLLIWERRPWLIDHGSALYAHHAWATVDDEKTRLPFPLVREHVLLSLAGDIEAADAAMTGALREDVIFAALTAVPDALLMDPLARDDFDSADAVRERYRRYLTDRLRAPRAFVEAAVRAREQRRTETPQRLETRR